MKADYCEIDWLEPKRCGDVVSSRPAQAENKRYYFAKSRLSETGRDLPLRLANEAVYYFMAQSCGLQMPHCDILTIEGKLHWGCEALRDRPALHLLGDSLPRERNLGYPKLGIPERIMRKACESESELEQLALAILLDLALLNGDRQPNNILGSIESDSFKLWYYDHDRCLFGSEHHMERAARDPRDERMPAYYFECLTANDIVFRGVSSARFREIYSKLPTNDALLVRALEKCPDEWISVEQKALARKLLNSWWEWLTSRIANDPLGFMKHYCNRRDHDGEDIPGAGARDHNVQRVGASRPIYRSI